MTPSSIIIEETATSEYDSLGSCSASDMNNQPGAGEFVQFQASPLFFSDCLMTLITKRHSLVSKVMPEFIFINFVSLELSDTEIFRSLEINIMPSLLAFTSIGTLFDLHPGFSSFLLGGIPLLCGVTIPLRLDLFYLPVFPKHSSRTHEDMWGSNSDTFSEISQITIVSYLLSRRRFLSMLCFWESSKIQNQPVSMSCRCQKSL